MGLDMYLNGEKFFWNGNTPTEDGFEVKGKELRLGYWRKHPNLHGFIVNTFGGGKDDCQEIGLSLQDLEKTLAAVKSNELPSTSGFFFGASDDEDREPTIEILEKAILWLKTEEKGASRSVNYRASW